MLNLYLPKAKYQTPFFCIQCKCPIFTHNDGVTTPHTIQGFICPNPNCKLTYDLCGFVNNIENANKNITVVIAKDEKFPQTSFHCYECRTTVFQFQGHILNIIPGKVQGTPLIISKCPDSRCNIKYSVYEF